MNFDFTDDQQAIKRTAHDLLAQRFKPDTVRELAEGAKYEDAHWTELAELGWPGIFISEEHGGQGLGTVELVILMEELGYSLAPVPFLSNAAAGLVLQHAGTDEQRSRWLPGIASGEARGTAGLARDGEAVLVPDADSAEVIVLLENGGGAGVRRVRLRDRAGRDDRRHAPLRARARQAAASRWAPTPGRRSTASRPPPPPSWWASRSG